MILPVAPVVLRLVRDHVQETAQGVVLTPVRHRVQETAKRHVIFPVRDHVQETAQRDVIIPVSDHIQETSKGLEKQANKSERRWIRIRSSITLLMIL